MLFDIDPLTGAVETFHYDHSTKTSTITRSINVDAFLDQNVASYNEGSGKSAAWRGEDNDMWLVARVPLELLQVWLEEFNKGRSVADRIYSFLDSDEGWERFMYAKVNSSEYRKLKTAPVTI